MWRIPSLYYNPIYYLIIGPSVNMLYENKLSAIWFSVSLREMAYFYDSIFSESKLIEAQFLSELQLLLFNTWKRKAIVPSIHLNVFFFLKKKNRSSEDPSPKPLSKSRHFKQILQYCSATLHFIIFFRSKQWCRQYVLKYEKCYRMNIKYKIVVN